jgi:protein-S-isoprenylcysteine O-methyltransferase Ste14
MARLLGFLYGLAAYAVFFATILYAIGFVTGLFVPKTINTGTVVPLAEALIVNLLLMSLFAVQHSVMARKPFKRWLTQYIPASIERSTYVLLASLCLVLLFWQWRPMPAVVWQTADPNLALAVTGVSMIGWVMVFFSTFLINHFELFGLHQVTANLAGRTLPEPRFRTPVLYKMVRHPIYLGFIIAFWIAPVMTVGHMLFAAVTTAYILVGIALEERDLVELFGDEYRSYRKRVSMLVPWRKSPPADAGLRTGQAGCESA